LALRARICLGATAGAFAAAVARAPGRALVQRRSSPGAGLLVPWDEAARTGCEQPNWLRCRVVDPDISPTRRRDNARRRDAAPGLWQIPRRARPGWAGMGGHAGPDPAGVGQGATVSGAARRRRWWGATVPRTPGGWSSAGRSTSGARGRPGAPLDDKAPGQVGAPRQPDSQGGHNGPSGPGAVVSKPEARRGRGREIEAVVVPGDAEGLCKAGRAAAEIPFPSSSLVMRPGLGHDGCTENRLRCSQQHG
jgi:hypothetical protein